jgi:hypothetical protein
LTKPRKSQARRIEDTDDYHRCSAKTPQVGCGSTRVTGASGDRRLRERNPRGKSAPILIWGKLIDPCLGASVSPHPVDQISHADPGAYPRDLDDAHDKNHRPFFMAENMLGKAALVERLCIGFGDKLRHWLAKAFLPGTAVAELDMKGAEGHAALASSDLGWPERSNLLIVLHVLRCRTKQRE